MRHVSHVTCYVSHLTCHISYFLFNIFLKKQRNKEEEYIKPEKYKIPHIVFIQCNEEFKKVCQFCNEDIVMKSLVVGMNQTREKLRSLNIHLTKKYQVARKKRVMLLVGNISLKEQEFLELSLQQYFVHIRGYPLQLFVVIFVAISFI